MTTKKEEIIIKGEGRRMWKEGREGKKETREGGTGREGEKGGKEKEKRKLSLWSKYQLYHNKDFANSQKWPENRKSYI